MSDSEHLFAFVNWPGYIGVTRSAAGIDTDWQAEYAALRKLSRVTGPAAFAAASARTAFGPVDVSDPPAHQSGPLGLAAL